MQTGITFNNCNVSSRQDAHYHWTFLNHTNGVTKGCGLTYDKTHIYIAKGFFIIFGRMVEVTGVETVDVSPTASGSLYCRLVYTVDLTKENTVENFEQGYFEILSSASGYPALTQEDLDADGTKYQMDFAKFIVGTSGITSFIRTLTSINFSDLYAGLEQNREDYAAALDEYIEELKNAGFVSASAYAADNTPEQIKIEIADWVADGVNFKAEKACSKASTSTACVLHLSLANPATLTDAKRKELLKNVGYIYPKPTVGNQTITFLASRKPTVALTFDVVGGIGQ